MNRLFQLNQMCGSIADGFILNTTAIGSSNHEPRSHSSSHTLNNQALSKQTINSQALSNLLLNNQAHNSSHQVVKVVLEAVKEEELTCSFACTITHVYTKFLVACLLFYDFPEDYCLSGRGSLILFHTQDLVSRHENSTA